MKLAASIEKNWAVHVQYNADKIYIMRTLRTH